MATKVTAKMVAAQTAVLMGVKEKIDEFFELKKEVWERAQEKNPDSEASERLEELVEILESVGELLEEAIDKLGEYS